MSIIQSNKNKKIINKQSRLCRSYDYSRLSGSEYNKGL